MVNTFKCCARLRAYGGILLEVSGKSIVNKIEKGREGLTLHIVLLTARGRRPAVQRTAGPGCRVSKSCHLVIVQINMETEKVFRLFLARGSRSPRSLKLCLLGAFFYPSFLLVLYDLSSKQGSLCPFKMILIQII